MSREMNFSHWGKCRVRDFILKLEAGVSVNSHDRPADKEEFGILKTSAVTYGVFSPNENKAILEKEIPRARTSPKKDRIILSRMNTPNMVGASAYIDKDYPRLFLPDRLWQLEPKNKKNICMKWLSYLLSSPHYRYRLSAIATGTSNSMKNISKDDVLGLEIETPSINEQNKIASIFSTWDTAIEKTERLIAAKEGRYRWMLRELINKGAENNGWKKAKLGTLFEEVTEKVADRDLTPFSISAGIGFVSQKEKWGKDIAGRQYKNYTQLKKGEFAYNKGNSKKYACGCVYLLRDHEEICVPNVFICFKRKDDAVHPEFYEHYFIADSHARELRKYISSGARSDGLLNLSKSDFFKIRVPFPPPEKQKFIAGVLSTARQEIDLHKKQLAALQKQKRGLMQKLLTGQWRVDALNKAEINNDV